MATDEKVRKDLDRKDRVEYLKDRNTEALQQSIIKVRDSQSPAKRSPGRSFTSGSPTRGSPTKR